MRRIQRMFQAGITAILLAVLLVGGLPMTVRADSANAPSLVISQLKITSSNGQLITLYNATNTAQDMSKYQLEYFNSYDLTKATSSRLIALSGTLPPHGYFMINDGALMLCYQATIDSVSLGLSSTAGLVEVLAFNQASPGSSATPVLQDYVGWSKTAANGAQTLPGNTAALLQRQPVDAQNNPDIAVPGTGSWQTVQPGNNPCTLVSSSNSAPVQTGLNQLLPTTEPAATIITVEGDGVASAAGSGMPSADIGLKAPGITEILPNPAGTGNDGTDEFIELYNSNNTTFDLSGFDLQVGTTTLHDFTFPAGTTLPAKSFTTFYSADTGLSLSNSGGQAKLLDPFGNSINTTGVYGTAKDGVAWALANGQWYWTTSPTPGAANIINQPAASKKASATAAGTKSKSLKAGKTKIKGAKTAKLSSISGSSPASDTTTITPIHPWTLALIAAAALLYGAYEYRADLANRIHQFRSHFRARWTDRA